MSMFSSCTQLEVSELKKTDLNININELAILLDKVTKNGLTQIPWSKYNYKPSVEFTIAYNEYNIFLKYYVSECSIRAVNTSINSSVWEDSCVEFFIKFEEDNAYYNFEFNCIGTALVGYGESQTGRLLLPEELISNIVCKSVIVKDHSSTELHWELTVVIPKSLFCYTKIDTLKGKRCTANFYKCGDLLPVPHFISWSNILAPEPNFHLPEFFGTLYFL